MQLILKDETVIDLMPESIGHAHLVVACASKTAFTRIWSKLTSANLEEVTFQEDGVIIETASGVRVTGTQTHNMPDGSIIGHFYVEAEVYVTLVGRDYPSDNAEEPEELDGEDPASDQEDEPEESEDTEEPVADDLGAPEQSEESEEPEDTEEPDETENGEEAAEEPAEESGE